MNQPDELFASLLGSDEATTGRFEPPLVNIGVGTDVTIRELAQRVREVVGFAGDIVFDTSKLNGTPQKLLDVGRLSAMGWKATTDLKTGLAGAYADFLTMQAKE